MFFTLGFMILLYLKLTDQIHFKWIYVFLPLSYFIKVIATESYFYFSPLRKSHKTAFRFFLVLLIVEALLLIVFVTLLATYLDHPEKYKGYLSLIFIPLLVILLSTFALYLYLLPGMLDPETNMDRRHPFLAMIYYLTAFALIIMLSINE